MLIKNKSILVSKVELKTNAKGQAYLWVEFMDMADGSSYSIAEKNVELMSKLQSMSKKKVNLELTGNKYGLKLSITEVLEDLGQV